MPFLVLLYTMFKLYGCSTRKRCFHSLVLDFGHWSVRDYVPFRHQIFGPNCDVERTTEYSTTEYSRLYAQKTLCSKLLGVSKTVHTNQSEYYFGTSLYPIGVDNLIHPSSN